jgi:alpha-L-arabinofuranosidase
LARVYATASLDQKSGDVILKVVNVGDTPADTKLDFSENSSTHWQAKAIVLSGSPDDVNTITEPEKIQPQEKTPFDFVSGQTYNFPPHSLTVLRLSKVR